MPAPSRAPNFLSPVAISGLRAQWRHWRLPVLIAALVIALQAAGLRGVLEYQRTAVLHGELWRVVSGNFVHLGWVHLARDLAGLALIWALFAGQLPERGWCEVLGVSAIAVGVGLLAFNPAIEWYVGISGMLFGMFCAGALCTWPARPGYASALLLGMAALIGWTLHAGALPGETAGLGGRVVPQAHLYGALAGGAVAVLRVGGPLIRKGRRSEES